VSGASVPLPSSMRIDVFIWPGRMNGADPMNVMVKSQGEPFTHGAAERRGGTLSSHRRRGVLPPPRRPGHRRHQPLQPEALGTGGLLQLPSPPRRPRRPDPLRTPTPESSRPTVIGLRQLHTCSTASKARTIGHRRARGHRNVASRMATAAAPVTGAILAASASRLGSAPRPAAASARVAGSAARSDTTPSGAQQAGSVHR